MVIPFKSLRYANAGPQVWGINVRRITMWKNETDYLSAVPAAYGNSAVYQMNVGGTLVGVETPLQSMNLELKPYVVSSLNTDRAASRRSMTRRPTKVARTSETQRNSAANLGSIVPNHQPA